jgi:hypothetical protein
VVRDRLGLEPGDVVRVRAQCCRAHRADESGRAAEAEPQLRGTAKTKLSIGELMTPLRGND